MNRKSAFTFVMSFVWFIFLEICLHLFGIFGFLIFIIWFILNLLLTNIYKNIINDKQYTEDNYHSALFRLICLVLFSFSFILEHYNKIKEEDYKNKEFEFYFTVITVTLPFRITWSLVAITSLILLNSAHSFSTKKPS
jgi:membrane-bound ClpP family serine protease